ncbi:MAG TPA: helix-hairpin-helix domain-containing protein [Bacteroidales bacterium]|nr:helix-hairpin-helix domain-containing protein [Bacteroidales bacterium]HRW95036.1 helix-hairpin-helix domain-containing protein [Bacteroidales bacterium]
MKWDNRHHFIIHASGIAAVLVLFSLRMIPVNSTPFTYRNIRQITAPFHEYCETCISPRSTQKFQDTLKKKVHSVPEAYHPFVPMKIELNTADSAELVKLFGIGPYYATRILEYREKLGGFAVPEQLLEVYGMDEERLEGFYEDVFADTSFIRKMDVKTVTEDQLATHIYIGRYLARCIIRYRETAGQDSCTLENLIRDKILTVEQAGKIGWYLY